MAARDLDQHPGDGCESEKGDPAARGRGTGELLPSRSARAPATVSLKPPAPPANMPRIASPAISPLASSVPFSSTAARRPRGAIIEAVEEEFHRGRRRKIADGFRKGRYLPRRSASDFSRRTGSARCRTPAPITSRPHAISPPTMPLASCAISPACGAGSERPPMPAIGQVGLVQHEIGPHQEKREHGYGQHFDHFHLPRRATPAGGRLSSPGSASRRPNTPRIPQPPRPAPRHARQAGDADGHHQQALRINSADRVRPDSGWFELPPCRRGIRRPRRAQPGHDITSAATMAGIHHR